MDSRGARTPDRARPVRHRNPAERVRALPARSRTLLRQLECRPPVGVATLPIRTRHRSPWGRRRARGAPRCGRRPCHGPRLGVACAPDRRAVVDRLHTPSGAARLPSTSAAPHAEHRDRGADPARVGSRLADFPRAGPRCTAPSRRDQLSFPTRVPLRAVRALPRHRGPRPLSVDRSARFTRLRQGAQRAVEGAPWMNEDTSNARPLR